MARKKSVLNQFSSFDDLPKEDNTTEKEELKPKTVTNVSDEDKKDLEEKFGLNADEEINKIVKEDKKEPEKPIDLPKKEVEIKDEEKPKDKTIADLSSDQLKIYQRTGIIPQ